MKRPIPGVAVVKLLFFLGTECDSANLFLLLHLLFAMLLLCCCVGDFLLLVCWCSVLLLLCNLDVLHTHTPGSGLGTGSTWLYKCS